MSELNSREIIALLKFVDKHYGQAGIFIADEEKELMGIGRLKEGDVKISKDVAKKAQNLADSMHFVTFERKHVDPWSGTVSPVFLFSI